MTERYAVVANNGYHQLAIFGPFTDVAAGEFIARQTARHRRLDWTTHRLSQVNSVDDAANALESSERRGATRVLKEGT